jgi:hypothetical protein
MQTRNGVGAGRIRTLNVFGSLMWLAEKDVHHWRAVAQLLKGPFGSGLESIKLDELVSYGGHKLWTGLEASEQSRNLCAMEVECAYNADLEFSAMLRHLPNMLYLRKLKFYWRQRDSNDLWKLLSAIRNNGSLHFVEGSAREYIIRPSILANRVDCYLRGVNAITICHIL